MMVGVAIGLIVVAAAAMLVATQLAENRRLLLETQIQQDLRATADIITREFRRSGFWSAAREGVWYPETPNVRVNPFTAVSVAESDDAVALAYSQAGAEVAENRGFRLSSGVVQTLLGDTWQALTDGSTLRITQFTVSLDTIATTSAACPKVCADGTEACWPTISVRELSVDISGEAISDVAVQRSVRNRVRLRNDLVVGSCPA